jgi:pantetheine-phosphate adenylyltransferase
VVVALYPGTFDPVTNGHVDIVQRGARLFDRLIVAVGVRVEKEPLLERPDRVRLLKEAFADLENVSVESFDGLVVGFAQQKDATVLLRGIRNQTDYEYENQMAFTNRRLAPGLETVLLVAKPELSFLSSTLIKEVLHAGGSVEEFVPAHVAKALQAGRRS